MFAFVARSFEQISSLVVTLLAARFLVPAEYGVYSLAIVFIMLIQAMTYTGLFHFVVTSKEDDDAVLSTGFWMIVGLATAASGVLAVAAWPISNAYRAPDLGPVLVLLALVQPLNAATAWFSAVLMRREKLNRHFVVLFIQSVVALVGGVFLLWLWQSLYALVAYRYLSVFVGAAFYFFLSGDRPRMQFDRELAKRAARYSSALYGSRFLTFLSRYAGDLLLGLMFSTAEVGLYRFGNRVAGGAIDIVSQPMRSFAITQFSAAERKGQDLSRPIENFVGTALILTGGVGAAVIVFAPTVVDAFFDPAYLGGIVVTYAIAVRGVLGIGAAALQPALTAQGRTGKVLGFTTIFTAVTLAAVIVSAPFGLAALAWSQAAVAAASSLAAFWTLHKVGISVRRTISVLALSGTLVLVYGLVLAQAYGFVTRAIAGELAALSVGLAIAAILGTATILLGWRSRVFTLKVFFG